jgi:sugar phosphate isomerase/epimerase
MKFGASIWPFQWDPPYDRAIRRIAGLGFRAIELIAWTREVLDTYYTPATIRELKAVLDGEGVELSELVSTPRGMASEESARREAAVEHFRRLIDVAVELGTSMVNTVSSYPLDLSFPHMTVLPLVQQLHAPVPPGLDWSGNWMRYVDVVRRCAQMCEEAAVHYALEAHPFRYVSNAAGMLRLIDHVGSPALGMNFDPSHLFPCGEIPHVVVYQLAGRIFHCHFSDNDAVTNVHWRPGQGKIDWVAVLRALSETGFGGTVSIELEDVSGVSRGAAAMHGAYGAATSAGEAFDRENLLALGFLRGLCTELNIPVD